jgi:hypothetical protein
MALGTASVAAAKQGVATGVLITCQQIGLALGVSVSLTVLSASTGGGTLSMTGFRHSFLATSIISGVGLLCMLAFTRPLVKRTEAGQDALAKPV